MNNYEYILAGAPELRSDLRNGPDPDEVTSEILSLLSENDRNTAEFLLKGFIPDEMTESYYLEAARSRCRFIRDYFYYDRNVRNIRAGFINRAFDKDPSEGQILPDKDFADRKKVEAILSGNDILKREREMDELMWEEADRICELSVLNLDLVLNILAKLRMISRWMKLNAETGHEMLKKLLTELRQNSTDNR